MYGLLGLLSTSGEKFKSTAPLEIYLLRKIVTRSILILPAVYSPHCLVSVFVKCNLLLMSFCFTVYCQVFILCLCLINKAVHGSRLMPSVDSFVTSPCVSLVCQVLYVMVACLFMFLFPCSRVSGYLFIW